MSMFWGCTIPARFPFIEKATRLALHELGIEPVDVPGFTCCPETTLVKAADEEVYYLTAARNLALAEERGLPLLTPCNGCYSTFKSVLSDLRIDWRMLQTINRHLAATGMSLRGDVDVWHLAEWLSEDLGPAALSNRIVKPFWGMKLAVHYGCHMLRPSPAVRWDSPTAPTKFEQLVRALGATVIDYQTKMDCCGNALDRVGERRASLDMLGRKLSDVVKQGADALVVSCPSCFLQFDLNQATLLRESAAAGVPVFYITELIALGLGIAPSELGLDMHRVGVGAFLDRWAVKLDQREALVRSFDLRGLQTCATCRACDSDCPVAQSNPDFVPSTIIARLVAGDLEAVLQSPDLWLCVDCMTCFERCPSRMGMAEVFERLKRLARERGMVPAAVRTNYEAFLANGTLGAGRPATRERLGLPEVPANGLEELRKILAEAQGRSFDGPAAAGPGSDVTAVHRAVEDGKGR
jgi:heterodisulfide reductase subunit B